MYGHMVYKMKFIKKLVIPEIIREEEIDGVIYQGIAYFCPTCHVGVLPYQQKCECGQRLKIK